MDRRDSLKALTIGSLSVSALLNGCDTAKKTDEQANKTAYAPQYGRTPEEAVRDAKLKSERFFTDAELATITVLADIIIPADENSGSASGAKVPEFIEFIVKDQPGFQHPMRGGLRWIDMQTLNKYNKIFVECSKEQQLQLVDKIAYPTNASPEMSQGVAFFNTMRNLTATGFFTSKEGIKDLGYVGNTPNNWDGVPEDVLKHYGYSYDEKTLSECLQNEDRGKIMTWPERI